MKTTIAQCVVIVLSLQFATIQAIAAEFEARASTTAPVQDVAASQPEGSAKGGEPAVLTQKLLGDWKGPACGGDFTFNANGTFELKHFTPGNNTLTGAWSIRWDALPPTLVLMCKTSDFKTKDPSREEYPYLGKSLEVKVVELNSATIAFRFPNEKGERRFSRRNLLEQKLLGTWYGPDCGGDYAFAADGAFQLKNFTPGRNTLSGTWSIRWDALPPTLVILCKTADFEGYALLNKPLEVKLLELKSDSLALLLPDNRIFRYSRDKKTGGSSEQLK